MLGSHPSPASPKTLSRAAAFPALAALLTLTVLAAALPSHGQARRCDLVGRDTTVAGVGYKRCLDLGALDGDTLTIPINVTRIDNDGLSLCKSSIQQGGNADIVYIYDNSGSMGTARAFVNAAGTDTIFYENYNGCTDTTTTGTVTYSRYTSNGTGTTSATVRRLRSNTGCNAISGDPYYARARAMLSGLNYQAGRARNSTAGIMSFTGSVANVRRPLVLNTPDNLTNIQSGINAVSNGGTVYRHSLDTAKRWLNSSITSNPRKAIIFLSDGRPNDTAHWAVLSESFDLARGFGGKMPPIYGIFLGRPIADTANLAELSRRTGGQFFLIPSRRPDSLVAVVERILNIVLLEYEPTNATVTNTLNGQTATATAPAGFVSQTSGSWLMRLNDVIALSRNDTNRITVTTQFRERNSGATESQTISFMLRTTGPATAGSGIITNTQFARTCYDRSSLRILTRTGDDPPAFTEGDDAYQPVLRTSPVDLSSASARSLTRVEGDAESPVLSTRTAFADSTVFRSTLPFIVLGNHTNANGTLESETFDTMVVTWVHPRDSQDVASDTMPVRSANRAAEAWFAETRGGERITQYRATADSVHVVIRDQTPTPGRSYTAVITSDRLGLDRETVTLVPLGNGLLGAGIRVNPLATKAPADAVLQVFAGGDQLRVVYRDPVFGDSAVGTAGFDESVQETPTLAFTDAAGNVLDSSAVWSPARGKLHVLYSDDYASGRVNRKTVSLSLVSRRYGAALGTDDETLEVTMRPHTSGTRATWIGDIDLADAFPAVDSNDRAETRYRGEATITAFSHDNAGVQQATAVTDFLVVAYPDSQASITWAMADSGQVTAGASEGLVFTVRDQDFTVANNDSAAVTVACARSGDSVSAFAAREAGTGTYRTGVLAKDEAAPNPNDRTLSCLSADQIVVRYTDPVYGTTAQLTLNEVARPVASPAGRRFVIQEFVSLSTATPGAVIHYTLDGTPPRPGVSPVYSGPIQVTRTTTIRAIATLPGWKDSKVMTETYTKEAIASRLEILDENGNAPTGGYLTGTAKAFRIKVTTTQANLPSVEVGAATRVSGDADTLTLSNSAFLGTVLEYWQNVPLDHDAARQVGDGTIQSRGTDTLIAVWRNPFDPSDVARDTLVIKPAFVAAEVYFSQTAGGPRITTYPVNTDTVFIVVKTRPRDPDLAYTVTVTSREVGTDTEVLNLTEVTPGVFTAKVAVGTNAKSAGDGTLQVAVAGDQLTAEFQDPVYKDRYRGDAGFAQQVQETASLQFIHADGRLVAPDEIWDPAAGRVFLRYTDDWNAGIDSLVRTLKVKLELVNRRSGSVATTDEEEATLSFVSSAATRGTWEGSLQLRDRAVAAASNDTLETYYRGELTASIVPHSNAGVRGGAAATDQMVIAYPDRPAEILVRDTSGTEVTRPTTRVAISVKDQIHTTSGEGSITVTVACEGTGDRIQSLRLVWDGSAYVAVPPVAKGEGTSGSASDSVLTCRSSDRITVAYADPVYGDVRTGEARWTDQKAARVTFASVRDTSAITSAVDGADEAFLVIVEGVSPTRDKADTVTVVLTTPQNPGDVVRVKAVETGILTGRFIARVPYGFIPGRPDTANGRLEAGINLDQRSNRVVATAEAQLPDVKPKGDIALFSAYNMVVKAYMQDKDGDGRADRAVFAFDKRLARLPGSLPVVAWNEQGESFRKSASAGQLSFEGRDSTVVAADFSGNEFGEHLTGIPDGRRPYAAFPVDNLFGGQEALLADSVGAVPVTAVKFPSNMASYNVTATEKRFYPDTLVLTVSEELASNQVWIHMARFSKGCVGYEQSSPLRLYQEPMRSADNPLEWTLVVDNSPSAQIPLVGDCIHLETDGRYTDIPGNRPGILGAKITGENPKLVIRDFRGFPPVAGLDARDPAFVAVNSDSRKDNQSPWSTQSPNGTWEVIWIPPAGFTENDPVNSVTKMVPAGFDPRAQPQRDIESQSPMRMPSNLSAVQVIATGRYIARISIYDNFGNHVRTMVQAFGFWGEEKNPWRATDKGLRSYLVWDLKDQKGQKAGQGVYVWKVNFAFSDKKNEIMYTRTGVVRP